MGGGGCFSKFKRERPNPLVSTRKNLRGQHFRPCCRRHQCFMGNINPCALHHVHSPDATLPVVPLDGVSTFTVHVHMTTLHRHEYGRSANSFSPCTLLHATGGTTLQNDRGSPAGPTAVQSCRSEPLRDSRGCTRPDRLTSVCCNQKTHTSCGEAHRKFDLEGYNVKSSRRL